MTKPTDSVLKTLKEAVGPDGWVDDPEELEPYLTEWRGLYRGRTPLLIRPATTKEVSRVVTVCAEHRVGIVPQGGNTGLCGGGVPDASGAQILLNLTRMNRVRAVDRRDATATVDAGCVLADLQSAAEDAGFLFPLSLAAEGSCTIGGNLSTDAGGVHVVRYGTMRDLTLGLEVVLPDGRVWGGLRRLYKDTAGYDLKQLFIGAEGTLGVITGAVLRLFPKPLDVATAWVGISSVGEIMSLFEHARTVVADELLAFEFLPFAGLEFVLRHIPDTRSPLTNEHPWYVLIELGGQRSGDRTERNLERLLETAAEKDLITDAAIATSGVQAEAFWRLRESMSEAQKKEGGSIKHDVSVPLSAVDSFVESATEEVRSDIPGIRVVAFVHAGDGNVHFNLSQPVDMERDVFLSRWNEMSRIVHDNVKQYGGSICAEHGVGQLKRDELLRYRDPVEIGLMQTLKKALDPHGIMNPGKVIPGPEC